MGLASSPHDSANSCNLAFCSVVQARRNFDLNADVQIAVAIALQIFHALAFDAKGRARLRAGGNFNRRPAVERRHFNFRAESRLDKTDRHFAEQVVAVALKNFMRLDMQHDVKIARWPAAKTGFAVAGGTQARTRVHTRRDAELDFGAAFALAFAVAGFAGLFHDASRAIAVRTRLRDAKDAAGGEHLPASAAGRAGVDF